MITSLLIRCALLIGVIVWFLQGGTFPFVAAVGAALVAYDGITWRLVWWGLLVILGAEIMAGRVIGSVVAPWLLTVMAFASIDSVIALSPLSRTRGWSLIDITRASMVAMCFFLLMNALTLAAVALVQYGGWSIRLSAVFAREQLIEGSIVCVGLLLVLRLCDEPLTRRITFGS